MHTMTLIHFHGENEWARLVKRTIKARCGQRVPSEHTTALPSLVTCPACGEGLTKEPHA
jgi:hypothetical protein